MNHESSSDSEDIRRAPKRYKLPLHPGYTPSDVSSQTRKRWEKRRAAAAKLPKSAIPIPIAGRYQSGVSSTNSNSSSEPCHRVSEIDTSTNSEADDNTIVNSAIINDTNNSQLQYDEYVVPPNHNELPAQEDEYGDGFEDYMEESDIDGMQSEVDDSDDDENDLPHNQKIDFYNQTMFPDANLKVCDVIVMITALSLDLKLPDEGKLKLAKFTKVLAGERFDNLNLSKYMMDKCFSSQDEYVTYNFYCSSCSATKLYSVSSNEQNRNREVVCSNCSTKNKITTQSPNYFLSVDLKYQIEQLLSDPSMINDILTNVQSRNRHSEYVDDVNAGSIHKDIIESFASSADESEIMCTVNMNTDGAPLTKSGKRGFWPVQIILNDLSPRMRFRNVLLSGLLLTDVEPKSNLLNLYLSEVYVKQMDELYEKGIEIRYKGRIIILKFCSHACPVDSVCRPIIQNRLQFNGYSGCSWGYQLGEYIHTVRGVRYPVNQSCIERTNVDHEKDVTDAIETGKICNGVKGDSSMSKLPHFDMVWSFPYEYLHALCLGTTKTIWDEWKSGDSEYKISKQQVDFIEKRFLHITPTHDIHRLPRSGIIKGSAKPKASELKSWLLLYSLPCLKNVLHEEALKHYSLLVKSSFTALKPAQSDEELDECDEDLLSFEVDYEKHYGKGKMTFNNHTLRHVVSSIRKTGSLCYNSAFPFESNIYTLKRYVNGPKGMDRQIARKHLQYFIFKTGNIGTITSSVKATMFCSSLFNPIKFSKSFRHGSGIIYCGKSTMKYIFGLGNCMVYKRCIYNNTLYHGEKYAQSKKTNDSMIQLTSGRFAKIIEIVEYNAKPYVQIRLFNMFPEEPFPGVKHIQLIESEHDDKIIIPVCDIESKVILVNVYNARYLCKMPNNFEIQ